MARQTSAVEFNNFVAGLITEASPMNFPPNASLDEQNFVLRRDGSRRRRLGLDFEDGHVVVNTGVEWATGSNVEIKVYRWRNVGGDPTKNFIVVQTGNEIRVFDANVAPLSSGLVFTKVVTNAPNSATFSFAVVDGILVIATGIPEILLLEFSNGTISESSVRLNIRDLFGVADSFNGEDLRSGLGITVRPTSATNHHIYNLRNQTWGEARDVAASSSYDPIEAFYKQGGENVFPSNADVTTYSIYPDTANGGSVDLFWPKNSKQTATGSSPSPRGFFIIDALSRGNSRLQEYNKLLAKDSRLKYPISTLPTDQTPGGATCVSEYAGRVFYSGFSGEVNGADKNSPRMSSYVLFSKLVEDTTDINKCYQIGDPTSKESADLVDTDGGFIRIDGAYGIRSLINLGDGLVVVASNGVWIIQGGSEYGFTASNYRVTKITSYGCDNYGTIVQVDTNVMYWSTDGIYNIAKNQFGDYVADNLTTKTVQTYYDDIDSLDKISCKGIYDSYEKKVYWIYRNRVDSSNGVKKLIFDATLGAFYPYSISSPTQKYPMLSAGVTVDPFRTVDVADDVEVVGLQVTAGGEVVTVTSEVQQAVTSETIYLALTRVSPTIGFSFCKYSNQQFKDWESVDGIGVDAYAYLLTGWMSGGDHQRYKQVPYVTFHFIKTEDGFATNGEDWYATNPSSCLVRSQWEWANHINSGKWSPKFQVYRFRRHYIPNTMDDNFDNGFYTVVTKNKLRGRGRVVSLLMETEPEKDCFLLGWSMVVESNGSV